MEILNFKGIEFLLKIGYFPGQFSLLIVPLMMIIIGLLYWRINKTLKEDGMNKTVAAIVELRNLLIKSGDDPEEFFPICRGCGYCCHEATCSLGVSLFGSAYPCPALFWNGEMYQCKLLSSWRSEDFADRLYIGSGCCSPLNSWRKEVKERWLNAISFKEADPDKNIKPDGV